MFNVQQGWAAESSSLRRRSHLLPVDVIPPPFYAAEALLDTRAIIVLYPVPSLFLPRSDVHARQSR